MEWSNELISEFLLLYKNETTLWNTNIPEHKNKTDAHEAWIRIKENLKDGSIPIKEIKKKRDNLMSTFRRQNKRVRSSMEDGSRRVFTPEWPFYSIMASFLEDVYKPRKSKKSDDIEEADDTEDEESLQNIKKEKQSVKRMKLNTYDATKRNDEEYIYQDYQNPETDTCSLYCNLLCTKLRGLKENTRDIAMMEIDRIIYNLKQQETNPQSQYLIPPILQPEFCHSSVPFLPTSYPNQLKQETSRSQSPQQILVSVSPGDFTTSSQFSPKSSCVTPTSRSPQNAQNSVSEESHSPILK